MNATLSATPFSRRQRLQPVAIRLALVRDEIGVRRAEHDVERVGMPRDDRGQRLDHRLDPLVRREQAEGQHDLAPLPAEARLEQCRDRRSARSGTPCGIITICSRVGAIDAAQDVAPALGHHDDLARRGAAAPPSRALVGARLFEHGVQRDDHRQRRAIEQREDDARPPRRRRCRIRAAARSPARRSPRSRARCRDRRTDRPAGSRAVTSGG